MPQDKRFEPAQVAAVELNRPVVGETSNDEFHVAGAHRQKRQEGEPGPEVHRDEPRRRFSPR